MERFHEYPTYIPIVSHRFDIFTNSSVKRGQVDELYATNKTLSKKEFDKLLQCPTLQPDLEGRNGCLSLLRLLPPTREIIEMMCVYAETRVIDWDICTEILNTFKGGTYPPHYPADSNGFESFGLFRVMSGNIYGDWPWGAERVSFGKNDDVLLFAQSVVSKISDIKDSVFFYGKFIPFHLLSYTVLVAYTLARRWGAA